MRRFRRRRSLLVLAALVLLSARPGAAEEGISPSDDDAQSLSARWSLLPSVHGGYAQMLRGYKGYDNLGGAGIDLYIRRTTPPLPDPSWGDNFLFRLSAEYFPLQVPEGNNGLEEDLYGFTAGVVYKFQDINEPEAGQWIPFLGLGAGSYLDLRTLDTRASGKVSGQDSYLGVNASAGAFLPFIGRLRLTPEVRFHAVRTPNADWATHIAYQLGLTAWFGSYDL